MRDRQRLVGKKVIAAYINSDRTVIRLRCDGDEFIDLSCYGDCCSETWIEHTNGACTLPAATILSTEDVDLGEGIATRQERDQLYAFKAKTDGRWSNEFSVEFRNSSNGYYGGSLEVVDGSADLTGFKPLTEDI